VPRAVMTIACFYSNMEIASARGRSAARLPRAAAYARAPCCRANQSHVASNQFSGVTTRILKIGDQRLAREIRVNVSVS